MQFSRNLNAWTTAGATKLLTTSLVANPGGWQQANQEATELLLSGTVTGTAPTSVEVAVEVSDDGSASKGFLPAVNSVSGGVSNESPLLASMTGAWATYNPQCTIVQIPPNCFWRVWAKRTGGDATTSLLLLADVSKA